MAILVDDGTRLVVQGITGREGAFHTGRMLESGTSVVAGVTPGRGGQRNEGVPIYTTVREAAGEAGANASVIFAPPPFAADAIFESLDSGMSTVCCITEGIPVHDMMRVTDYLDRKSTRLNSSHANISYAVFCLKKKTASDVSPLSVSVT